ncbi:MBL fold metallo-hydrolase RNA specificity domain-containing protein [Roseateles violae]|uniref:MBL fold metallo-hydrolase n=1 Tax=Roseateles violae TaxID=3058042 RepID=A0ABT8DXS4_9BURK|nr:MBL fold metallo-hydrolase [Pelomonas sp. PFR6]MDN3922219.1 MBL fold metallo-hydrolase [Pelomonas sp. PFR6]
MQLQFLGATGTVTGSKYLLRHAGATLMIDCGLFQGYKQLRLRNWAPLPIAAREIGALILTHAHIDHSGYLPLLARQGFRGPVFCTPATRDLCAILLPDSGHLQEEEAAYANRHGFSKHRPAEPLYTEADARRALALLQPVDCGVHWPALPGLTAQLAPSGHMLGSAFVRLEGDGRNVLFTGDLGRPQDPVLRPPEHMAGADILVTESTYGDRLHEPVDVPAQLAQVVKRTAARGGVLLIPAFAVGRAQTLLHLLAELKRSEAIPDLPVFLDSPMAADATALYWRHRGQHRLSEAQCAAMCHAARIVNTPDESRALSAGRGPMIIIAASGMATGGRVVHHLKSFAPDWRTTILLSSFQAGGTRGAALAAGAKTLRIHGEDVPVRAEVAQLGNLSGHADADELLAWLRGFARPPRQTFITHGEPAAADALRQRIERELGWRCRVPDYLEQAALD